MKQQQFLLLSFPFEAKSGKHLLRKPQVSTKGENGGGRKKERTKAAAAAKMEGEVQWREMAAVEKINNVEKRRMGTTTT